jgi:hypothetical protein
MIRKVTTLFLVSSLGLVATVAGVAWKKRTDAQRLLEAMARMAVQTDPSLELLILQREFGKRLESNCGGADCYYELLISNWRLSRTGLFPCCEIRASLASRNGSLSYFAVEFRQQSWGGSRPDFHVQEEFSREPRFSFFLNPHGKSEEFWNGDVDFNQSASEEERKAALGFNLNCFIYLKGCRDLSEMAPRIWKVTANGTMYSRMPSKADAAGDTYAP